MTYIFALYFASLSYFSSGCKYTYLREPAFIKNCLHFQCPRKHEPTEPPTSFLLIHRPRHVERGRPLLRGFGLLPPRHPERVRPVQVQPGQRRGGPRVQQHQGGRREMAQNQGNQVLIGLERGGSSASKLVLIGSTC